MLDILQEILQSHPFLMLQSFETQGYQWYGVKRIKFISWIRGIVEQGLGHLLITSSTGGKKNAANTKLHSIVYYFTICFSSYLIFRYTQKNFDSYVLYEICLSHAKKYKNTA